MTVAARERVAAPPPASRRGAAGGRRWRLGWACATLLVLLLPALLAGVRLAAPADAAEVARLERAVAAVPAVRDSDVARSFYRACASLNDDVPPAGASWQEFVMRARIGQLAALFAITALTYLVVLLARGRLVAIGACLALAVLPAVGGAGHVIRPETPALLFGAFAVLLLQCVAQRRRVRRPWATVGLCACAAMATGLAVAAMPTRAVQLLLPGFVLTVAALQLLLRAVRAVRRRGLARLPTHACNRRLLPWTALALLTPAVVLWFLHATVRGIDESLAVSQVAPALLPANAAVHWPLVVLLAVGAVAALLQVGARLRRRGRVGPDLVLLLACAIPFAAATSAPPGSDTLPLALAAAALLADGAFALVVLALRAIARPLPTARA